MTTETPNVIRMEVKFPNFERRIEEEFKPALRAAIEQVTSDFVAEIGDAVTVKEAAPRPTDLAALLASLEARQETYARRFEERIKHTNDRFAKLLSGIAA